MSCSLALYYRIIRYDEEMTMVHRWDGEMASLHCNIVRDDAMLLWALAVHDIQPLSILSRLFCWNHFIFQIACCLVVILMIADMIVISQEERANSKSLFRADFLAPLITALTMVSFLFALACVLCRNNANSDNIWRHIVR